MNRRESPSERAQTGGYDGPIFVTSAHLTTNLVRTASAVISLRIVLVILLIRGRGPSTAPSLARRMTGRRRRPDLLGILLDDAFFSTYFRFMELAGT